MNDKTKLGPGGVSIILGMLGALGGAILLPVVLFGQMPEFSRLKSEGLVVDALITAKQTELTTNTKRRQAGSSENFFFVVSFDPSAGVPFAEASDQRPAAPANSGAPKSGADIVAGLDIGGSPTVPGAGAGIQARVNAGSFDTYEQYQTGEAISVTYLPGEPSATRLTAGVRGYNPVPIITAGLALLFGGLLAVWLGWRRRLGSKAS
jgi:hypothetical protein